jgi:hypothetical protein
MDLLTTGELRVRLFGEWVLAGGACSSVEVSRRLGEGPRPTRISFDARKLGAWDNVLIDFVGKLEAIAAETKRVCQRVLMIANLLEGRSMRKRRGWLG